MANNFLDLNLAAYESADIHTLGPGGTSSEAASFIFSERMKKKNPGSEFNICLNNSYEGARLALNESFGLLVVANAYSSINNFYMDPRLCLIAIFVFETPLYGLASKGPVLNKALKVISHPAPVPLIKELMPKHHSLDKLIIASSTSAAAIEVSKGGADAALTTELAAGQYGLTFISKTRTINMLWSVFGLIN